MGKMRAFGSKLRRTVFIGGLLASLWCVPSPIFSQTILPDTIAAKRLNGFLDALNSGDRARLKSFLAAHFALPANDPGLLDRMTDDDRKIYTLGGGIEVKAVLESSPAAIKVLARAKATGMWNHVSLFTTAAPPDYKQPAAPYQIVGVGFSDVTAPAAATKGPKLTNRELHDRIARLMAVLTKADAFSGIVYVAKNGRPIYAQAFGLANRSWMIPNRIDTRFNLASVTKMFTAVAIAQLVEHGKLSYDQTVGQVLPDYPNKAVARTVTIGQLLSHTSGMIGARPLAEKAVDPQSARTLQPWLDTFVNEPLSAAPGQRFDYSNAGYILLGAIIEKASGQSYYDYVADHVFKPAGMTDTSFYDLETDPPNLATGFMDGPGGTRRDNIFALTARGAPHAGAYSTGPDMVKFHLALVNHRLLSAAALKTLWTGVTEEADKHRQYGYGAYIERYNGHEIISHGGGWQGITNQFEFYPGLGYTVVILSNIDDDPTAIAYKLREWLTQSPSNASPAAEPAADLKTDLSVTGHDAVGSPLAVGITVTNKGGTAHAAIVDMEIVDAQGNKVDQQVTEGQRLTGGETRTFTYRWTPSAAGKYSVNIGLFGPGWTPKYRFDAAAATIEIK
jgi:CubicO group peptidase (beta-lactamase class C family)